MRALPRVLLPTVLPWAFAAVAAAQGQDPPPCEQSLPAWCELSEAQAEFLRQSRRATEAYRDPAAAVADGFRPMGADAPAMGRHWVSFARLFDGRIDARKPEILMYTLVDGRESLVGIGFGHVVGGAKDSSPPANPFDSDAWHVHSGRFDMESHRMDHVGDGLSGAPRLVDAPETGAGVSVLHAWVWTENPRGVIEPNNWTLPYFRLGLRRPVYATPEADRALSLAAMGAGFFVARAELLGEPGSGPGAGLAQRLRRAEAEVGEWWQARPEGALTSTEVEWLDRLWRCLGPKGLEATSRTRGMASRVCSGFAPEPDGAG